MAVARMENFPNDPIFTSLFDFRDTVPGVVISDEYGFEAGYKELFDDIVKLRQTLREQLPAEAFDSRGLLRPECRHVMSITTSIYHFVVGFFTIVSLGGACAPVSDTGTLDETIHCLNQVKPSCILFDPWTTSASTEINNYLQTTGGQQPSLIQIQLAERTSISDVQVAVDENLRIPEKQAGLIIFSSGTTGKPKGVVLPRQRFSFPRSDPSVTNLTYRPVHWISSGITPIRSLLMGERCICLKRGASPGDVWEALRVGNITSTAITPTRLKAMQEYYYSFILPLSPEEHDSYVSGASKLKLLISTGSILHPATAKFYKDTLNIRVVIVYGSTELACPAFQTTPDSPTTDACLGKLEPTVSAKLSDGDEGELFLKTEGMFTGYLGNEEATKAIFDEEGYYKTGDIVRREGDQYFFMGRASTDWIRFSAFTISVVELEKRLLELPYISEAYVLPIMDYEARELVAAVIRLRKDVVNDESHPQVNLHKVREDLSLTTEPYKLPRLLRILNQEETIPFTASEKAKRNEIRTKYFKLSGYRPRDYSVPGVEFFGNETGSQFLASANKLPPTKE